MQYDIAVHGVPRGLQSWGMAAESGYLSSFYNSGAEPNALRVELRNTAGGAIGCFYSYVVSKGVYDSGSRAGSYCALTLQLDCYLKCVSELYVELLALFNEYIVGRLLLRREDSFVWNTDVSVAEQIRSEIEKRIGEWLSHCNRNDFISAGGFKPISGQIERLSLVDCSIEKALEVMRQAGKLYVSPYFESEEEMARKRRHRQELSAQEQRHQQQLAAQKKQDEQELKEERAARIKESTELKAQLDKEKNAKTDSQSKLQEATSTISQLNARIKKLEEDSERRAKSKRAEEIVSQIQQPIRELAEIMGRLEKLQPQKEPNDLGKGGLRLRRARDIFSTDLMTVVAVVLIVLFVVALLFAGLHVLGFFGGR